MPNFKKVFGQLNCPIDHINEVRPADLIPVNHLLLAQVQNLELFCVYHTENSADFVIMEEFEPVCEVCLPYFPGKEIKEWKDLGNTSDLLSRKIAEFSRNSALIQRLSGFPGYFSLLNSLPTLSNQQKNRLISAFQNIMRGLNPESRRELPALPPPPKPVYTHYRENGDGSWVIDRFNRILPEVATLTPESKQWWLSATGRQVDAVVVMVNRRIHLLGIGLCKEVVPTPQSNITYVELLRGASTQSPSVYRDFLNASYSGSDRQVQELRFSKAISISPGEKLTIKVKQNGKGLFFGDPSTRIEPLIGPEDLIIEFDDPNYVQPDFQNGQNKWVGPIVRLYFRLA